MKAQIKFFDICIVTSPNDINTNYNNQLPRFHTKIIVFVFTCILSTFFGGILFSQNLYQIDKKKDIPVILIGCGLWQLLAEKLLNAFPILNALDRLFIINIVGAIVLTQLSWSYYFKNTKAYKRRKIWFPLLTVIVIYGTLILLNISV